MKDNISFDLEELNNCKSSLKNPLMIPIAENFHNGYESITNTLLFPYYLIIIGEHKVKYAIEKTLFTSKVVSHKHPIDSIEYQNAIKGFSKVMSEQLKNSHTTKETINALEALNALMIENEYVRKAMHSLYLNTASNVWTIFESIFKDLWITMLNSFPNRLINNITNNLKKDDNQGGIIGKSIQISLLAKYDFQVKQQLGTILSQKFDFTSLYGIKDSFEKLFQNEKLDFEHVKNDDLFELEILRHLIVHKAGKVDEDYLKKTKINKEKKIDDLIELDELTLTLYINSAIRVVSKSIKQIDNWI